MADTRTPVIMGDVTPATALLVQQAMGMGRRRSARRRTKKKATTRRRVKARASTRRRTAKRGGRLKKGSPEAKRRMAQLRRMQKRRR